MKHYQQIIDLCKQEFGELVLEAKITSQDETQGVYICIDASREEEITSFYPSLEKGQLKTYESWSNALNLYLHSGTKAHFYYKGSVEKTKDGKKYSEHFDSDGAEYDTDTVFAFDIKTPEEAVEWLRFIYSFRRTKSNPPAIEIKREKQAVSQWFEEPLVFLPGFSSELVPLKKVMTKFDVFSLPMIYNEAYQFGNLELKDYNNDFDKYGAAIREMNVKAQATMQEIEYEFKELAARENNQLKVGDFLLFLESKSTVKTYHDYVNSDFEKSEFYYIVLRPAKETSHTSLVDFLTLQKEGVDFACEILNNGNGNGLPTTVEYIPELIAQQVYVLQKKTGWAELKELVRRFSKTTLGFNEGPALINDCLAALNDVYSKAAK